MSTDPAALKNMLLGKTVPRSVFNQKDVQTTLEKGATRQEKDSILRTFTLACRTREELMATLESVKNLDVVQTIIDVVLDDAFSHAVNAPLFELSYDSGKQEDQTANDDITKEIQDDMKALGLDSVVELLLDDTVFEGESFIRHRVEQGKGIIGFYDDVITRDTMALYQLDKPVTYLEKRGARVFSRTSEEITQFCIGPRKIRIKVDDGFRTGTRRLKEYLRIGRSVVYPALDKIKALQTLELASLGDDLKRILAPILVTVGVPANASPQDLIEITEKYEGMLSDAFVNLANNPQMDLATVVSMLTNVRVVPSFTDGKGTVSTLDITADDKGTLDKIDANRTAIALATGVPPYYLVLAGESGQSKLETLKIYSRYSRKLLVLQDSMAKGIIDIVHLHYKKKTGVVIRLCLQR